MAEKTRARRRLTAGRQNTASARSADGNALIENWMVKRVVTVRPHDSVAYARRVIEERRINQLPVVVDGKLVGMVTDRDLRSASESMREGGKAAGADLVREDVIPENIMVDTVMSTKVIKLKPRDAIERAANLMHKERIGGIPVVERNKLVGIITRSDVLKAFVVLRGKAI